MQHLIMLWVAAMTVLNTSRAETLTVSCNGEFHEVGSTLECQCSPVDPGSTVSWPGHSSDGTLNIPNVQKTDNGKIFTCATQAGTAMANYTLKVAYGPSDVVITGPSPFPTDGNRNMTLYCNATEANPQPSLTWSGITCDNSQPSNECVFTPNTLDHDGHDVKCHAVNLPLAKKATDTFTIRLTSLLSHPTTQYTSLTTTKPAPPLPTTSEMTDVSTTEPAVVTTELILGSCPPYVQEGDDLICQCYPPPGVQDAGISWPGHSETSVLTKQNVNKMDSGLNFTCQMPLNGLLLTAEYVLQVAFGPTNDTTHIVGSEFLSNGSKTLDFQCIASVNPNAAFLWQDVTCENGNIHEHCYYTPIASDEGRTIICRATNTWPDVGGKNALTFHTIHFDPTTQYTSLTTTKPAPPPPTTSEMTDISTTEAAGSEALGGRAASDMGDHRLIFIALVFVHIASSTWL